MLDWLTGSGLRTTVGVSGCAVLVAVAGIVGEGLPSTALQFRQVGHWVYNSTVGAAFHVDGGSKQVDAKVGPFDQDLSGSVVVQGDSRGYVVTGSAVTVFGKSTLTVDTKLSVGSAERPEALETVGGPYLVYRGAGRIVRLGVSPQTVEGGGPLADAVATEAGELWVRRTDNGMLCRLPGGAATLDCPATVPAGHVGGLTVIGRGAAFLDLTAGTLALLGPDGFGRASRLPSALPADAKVARGDADGTLAVLDPGSRTLLFQPTDGLGERDLPLPVRVPLGSGAFGTPVAADGAVAVVDSSRGVLLTYTPTGTRKAAMRLPGVAAGIQVRGGDDGRVYVDDSSGAHTVRVIHEATGTPGNW